MIYVASLAAPTKKAYGDKCFVTSVARIIEQLSIDPKISQMDACVLGVKDVAGINRMKLQKALESKHPDVCAIYIFQKDKEGDLLDVPFKRMLKKITADSIEKEVDGFLGSQRISAGQALSRDAIVTVGEKRPTSKPMGGGSVKGSLLKGTVTIEDEEEVQFVYDEHLELYYVEAITGERTYYSEDKTEQLSPAQVQAQRDRIANRPPEPEPETEVDEDDDDDDIVINIPTRTPTPNVQPTVEVERTIYVDDNGVEVPPNNIPAYPKVVKQVVPNPDYVPETPPAEVIHRAESQLEQNIMAIKDFHDWNYFKDAMSRDAMVRELLEENASYQGNVQMLSLLDTQIKAVFYDAGLSSAEKLERVTEIGQQRSTIMAVHNDLIAQKIIDVVETISISARRTVEELLCEQREALNALNAQDKTLLDESKLDELITKRSNIILETLAAYKSLISLLQAMEVNVNDFILSLNENVPSDNKFVNEMFSASKDIFIPANTKEIANKMLGLILKTMSSNPGSLSALGQYMYQFVDDAVDILAQDGEIINYQQKMIRILKAHKVEEAVVIDGILKNVLNVYIGPDDSGRTSTTLTWSGCLSHRRNTLLVDLSNNSKVTDYGVKPIDLHKFMTERIDRPICVVAGKVADYEELGELVRELKTRLDYYAHINIVLDTTQLDFAKALAEEALTLNFITNCTNRTLDEIKKAYASLNVNNVAKKLIMIDPPAGTLEIAKRTEVDPMTTKCVAIPNMQRIKTCAVMHNIPYEYREVRSIYEEAFK